MRGRGLALLCALALLIACQPAPPPTATFAPAAPSAVAAAPSPSTGPSPTAAAGAKPNPNASRRPTAPAVLPPRRTANPGGLDPRFGIAEGFRNPAVMGDIGAGWERVVLSWSDIQPDGPDDFRWLGRTLPGSALVGELNRGVTMAGLLQFTPAWAATDSADPGRSVPRNLDLAADDPNNYWGRFVYETVGYYRGYIDEWILWNEPEFTATDAAAGNGSMTWLGTDAEFARLMEVGYLAAKRANPDAVVAFPGTSYWIDQTTGRTPYYERFLQLVASNPRARGENFFHDAVPLNLYRAPDDLVRLHQTFTQIQQRYGVSKPLWLLELNAMPTDDQAIPCASRHSANPIQTTQTEQAAYAIQAYALAAAVGYQRIGFYQMVDDDPCIQSAVWGITRDDGTRRPVATSLKTAVQGFGGYLAASFVPRVRPQARWAAWPDTPTSFIPNWQIYQVAFDLPDQRRITVLWNGDGVPLRVRVPRRANQAQLVTAAGAAAPGLAPVDQDWAFELPAATAHFGGDPAGYFFIGGEPRLLVEEGVPPGTPVIAPRLDQAG